MAVAAIQENVSVRDQVSAEEWKTRVDLAQPPAIVTMGDLTHNRLVGPHSGRGRNNPDQALRHHVRRGDSVEPAEIRLRR